MKCSLGTQANSQNYIPITDPFNVISGMTVLQSFIESFILKETYQTTTIKRT